MTETQPVDLASLQGSGQLPLPLEKLSQEEKFELSQAGTPFTITDVQLGNDPEFGTFWHVRIQLEGHETGFNLGSHVARDEFMEKLQEAVGSQPISNVRLKATKSRNGKWFFTLVAAS